MPNACASSKRVRAPMGHLAALLALALEVACAPPARGVEGSCVGVDAAGVATVRGPPLLPEPQAGVNHYELRMTGAAFGGEATDYITKGSWLGPSERLIPACG
jgi:hypothetical protein